MRAWSDTRPTYLQHAAEIRKRILAGDLTGQLPSVKQFMNMLETKSTSVVQRALATLEEEGFVDRRHGKGNFAQAAQVIVIDSTPDLVEGMTYRLRKVEEVTPPADVRAELGIGETDTAVLRQQVGFRGDDPVELVGNFYRLDLAAGTLLTGPKGIRGGAKRVLEERGHVGAEMVDVVMTRPPTEEEVVALELPEGVPVLAVLRAIRDEHGAPIEVSTIVKGGHRYALRHRTTLR